MRIRFLLSYIGTRYHGWQIQENTDATIQGALEKALSVLCKGPVRVTGAGRTDAGVHALGQVAHADIPQRLQQDLRTSLNALLPWDIRVLDVSDAPDTFHARFDAKEKTYIYHFWTEQGYVLPKRLAYVWPCGALDCDRMQEALPFLIGTHDFASLQNAGFDTKSSVRTILSATITHRTPSPYLPKTEPEYALTITADGFLKQMVRNIAGILVAVGKKKIEPSAVQAIVNARSRKENPCVTAPAAGLTLAHIAYPSSDA
ncbi:MAG: tRNA pseudouridine(38-40) synthase TruA [Desulfovibrionaceae bacterium]|nr:tRNA pseudouridine(38-40) synthase TruA [Desulfovibrionaceae bacterium]